MPGDAPEDIVVDADGALWTGLVDGRIVRIDPNSAVTVVGCILIGRPLGMTVTHDGRLLICTSPGGLQQWTAPPGTPRCWSTRSTSSR